MIIYSNFKQTFAHVRYLIPNCKSQSSCLKFMRFVVSYIREPIVLCLAIENVMNYVDLLARHSVLS